jgi:hypothetical protein
MANVLQLIPDAEPDEMMYLHMLMEPMNDMQAPHTRRVSEFGRSQPLCSGTNGPRRSVSVYRWLLRHRNDHRCCELQEAHIRVQSKASLRGCEYDEVDGAAVRSGEWRVLK